MPTVLVALLVAVAATAIWAATRIAQPATRDRVPAATAAADGGPHQTIEPGDSWLARFGVHQTASTGWYHPDAMGTTAEQVALGLAGMIIVRDAITPELRAQEALLPHRYGIDDIPLIIQDRGPMPMAHTFHLHSSHFQVLRIDGRPVEALLAGRKDTVIVPAHADVEIAVHFERHDGLFMYHCHMLEHEEHGMMGQLLVSAVAAASVPISLPTAEKER